MKKLGCAVDILNLSKYDDYKTGIKERHFEPSKGLVSQARALKANPETKREPERVREGQRE
jgi:hypothetical protein